MNVDVSAIVDLLYKELDLSLFICFCPTYLMSLSAFVSFQFAVNFIASEQLCDLQLDKRDQVLTISSCLVIRSATIDMRPKDNTHTFFRIALQ